jgi:hypothetical protein
MFQVFENGLPADNTFYKALAHDERWNDSKFHTFEAAVFYANAWLGDWKPELARIRYEWKLGAPYHYRYDDYVVICRIS